MNTSPGRHVLLISLDPAVLSDPDTLHAAITLLYSPGPMPFTSTTEACASLNTRARTRHHNLHFTAADGGLHVTRTLTHAIAA